MLTRAKRGLVIIGIILYRILIVKIIFLGDVETLVNDLNWKEYVNWCKANNILVNYK